MHYVYIIQSIAHKNIYIGRTSDLEKRLKYHNSGNVKSTKSKRPYKLIFYEAFANKSDAVRDEIFFKTGYGREILRDKIKNSIK